MTDPSAGWSGDVDFGGAVSLALPLDFSGRHPQHFGAPAAHSEPLQVGSFEGAVAHGASCNCRRITLVPHCHGTHTESVSHLTLEQRPLHALLPLAPLPALLLDVQPLSAPAQTEDSLPVPRPGDRLITRAALRAAWKPHGDVAARVLVVRTGTSWHDEAPPYLTRQCAEELVARGIEHLIIDLPSVDRLQDEGRLTAHRVFFGLPAGSTRLADAARPAATITELAGIPATLPSGPGAVQIQIPDWTGDAVPSRPLWLPRART